MAVTVNIQDNPIHDNIGTSSFDAVLINSGEASGAVRYQIIRRDGQGTALDVRSTSDLSNDGAVISVSSSQLQILLPSRQRFKVRVFANGIWSDWVNFKTRDKNYSLPAEITELSINDDANPTNKGNKTITVTNNALQTVEFTIAGARVTNVDFQFNDVTSITETAQGATIVTKNAYVA